MREITLNDKMCQRENEKGRSKEKAGQLRPALPGADTTLNEGSANQLSSGDASSVDSAF